MTRNSMVVIAALILAAGIAPLLTAQESSRRKVPKRSGGITDPPPTVVAPPPGIAPPPGGVEPPAFTPAPDNPPIYQPPASLGGVAPLPGNPPAAAPPPGFSPPGPLPLPPNSAPPGEMQSPEENQMRSVLKRSPGLTPEPNLPPGLAPGSGPVPGPATLPSLPRSPDSMRGSSRRVQTAPQSIGPGPAAIGEDVGGQLPARSIQELSVSGKSPAVRVDVVGPQGITVGKPAAYVVNVINEGDSSAEELLVRLSLPGWVTVRGAQPTSGEAVVQGEVQGTGRLMWSIPRVDPRSQEQLRLTLITNEGDGFDLGVEWKCKPTLAKAAIYVKQPKLQLSLAGPADMTFGEERVFTLSVTNPGSGDADRVVIAIASGNAPPQQIDVGSIPAGFKKDLPLQVVASQPGIMDLRIGASGEGGLTAETLGKITVRKAEVNVAIEGPPMKFAGTDATYLVTVANTGSAAADNVNLSLALPTGAKYLGGVEGAQLSGGGLKWKIASIAAGGERTYELRVQLFSPGLNRMVVQSQANASGTADSHCETEVQAISDLKLVVNDPSGPLPTEEQAVYEVQVMNRGTQAAQRVKILMQFSGGIEPVSYEGCDARIVPGQVVCQPLVQLGAGEQVTLRVKARAQQAGTHQFRVEVTTADGDARLVSEGTTRFFADAGRTGTPATTAKRASLVPNSATPATLQR